MPEETNPYLAWVYGELEKAVEEGSEHYAGTDIAAGIMSGLLGSVEGVAEIPAIISDLTLGTQYAKSVNEFVDEIQEYTGWKARGAAGEAAQAVGEVAGLLIPTVLSGVLSGGIGAAAFGPRFAKLAQKYMQKNLGKTGMVAHAISKVASPEHALKTGRRIGQVVGTMGGAGLADAVILYDGRTLVADYFTPDRWEDVIGIFQSERYSDELSPREDALRRIKNKLRAGAEGSLGYAAIKSLGLGVRGVGALTRVSLPMPLGDSKNLAELVGRAGTSIGKTSKQWLETSAKDSTIRGSFAKGILKLSRPHGLANEKFNELYEANLGIRKGMDKEIESLVLRTEIDIDNLINNENSPLRILLNGKTPHQQDSIMEELKRFIDPNSSEVFAANSMIKNKELIKKLKPIQNKITELQKKLAEELQRAGPEGLTADKAELVLGSIDDYIHRSYRMFNDRTFRTPRGKHKKRLIGEIHKLLRMGIKPDATLKEATEIANSIWKNRETFTSALQRKYTGEEFEQGLDALRKVEDLSNPFSTEQGMNSFLRSDEIVAGGAGAGTLKKKSFVSPVLREIYGEYTHPKSAAMNTIRSISADQSNLKFMNDIADMDLPALDGKKMVVDLPTGMTAPPADYVIVPLNSVRFGKLAGKLIHKSIKDEVLQTYKIDPTIGDKVFGLLYTMKGGFQAAKTILSPLTGFGNVISNIVPTAARMNFFRGGGNVRESLGLVIKQIRNTSSPEDLMTMAKMLNLNLADSVVDLNQSLRLLEEGLIKGNFSVVESLGRALGGVGDATKRGPVKKAAAWFMNKAQEVYRGEDDAFKLYNYFAEKAKYSEILPWLDKVPIDSSRSGMSVLDVIAAGNTRAILPSFDRMPAMMKGLRKIPFAGNFSSFAIESIRTGFNGIHMGLAEMAGQFRYKGEWIPIDIFRPGRETEFAELARRLGWMREVGGKQVPIDLKQMFRKAGNQFMNNQEINAAIDAAKNQLQRVGTRSVLGNLAAQSSMAYFVPKIGSMITGITKDEVDSFKRDLAMSWDANGSIVPIGRRHDGGPGFEYVNLAPINYYSTMQSTVKAFLNEWDRNANEGRGNFVSAGKALISSALTLADPFIGLSVPIEKLVDIGARGGRTREGSIVFREEDTLGTMLAKSLAHVSNAYVPGLVPLSVTWEPNIIEQVKKEQTIMETFQRYGGGMFTPGPALRGALVAAGVEGYDKDKYGWHIEPLKQFLPYMIRLRTQIADPVQPLTYAGYELSRLRRSVAGDFKRTIDRKPNATANDVMSAFKYSQKRLFDAYKTYGQKMETAKVMGMNEPDIDALLKIKKVGHRKEIVQGTFPPFELSEEVSDELRSRGFGYLIGMTKAVNRYLSQLDVSESEDVLIDIMDEILFGGLPERYEPPSMQRQEISPTATTMPARPTAAPVPAMPAPTPAVTPTPTAAGIATGTPQEVSVNPIILPNPKDLALAEQLQNV